MTLCAPKPSIKLILPGCHTVTSRCDLEESIHRHQSTVTLTHCHTVTFSHGWTFASRCNLAKSIHRPNNSGTLSHCHLLLWHGQVMPYCQTGTIIMSGCQTVKSDTKSFCSTETVTLPHCYPVKLPILSLLSLLSHCHTITLQHCQYCDTVTLCCDLAGSIHRRHSSSPIFRYQVTTVWNS